MNDLKEYINEHYPGDADQLIMLDGFDGAFIGIGYSFTTPFVCYSKRKIIDLLMDDDVMTYEEALEYFEFNISMMYVGENTPLIMEDC